MKNLIDIISKYDTPTICNAIEVAEGKRGFNQFSKSMMISSTDHIKGGGTAKDSRMVGFAKTAKIAAVKPSTAPVEDVKKIRMEYYRYMSEVEQPSIVVIEDLDYPKCVGAYWGEINVAIHHGFGLKGTLTNGLFRDLDELVLEYPILGGSLGPSHGFVHVEAVDCPVTVFGMEVKPGDLVHADKHGAIVIPPELFESLPAAIETLLTNEQIVLEPARATGFNFEKFKAAWDAFERART